MNAYIVGGGIMGLCGAWALRRVGFDVTVFDRGPIPNPRGASVDHHRLIRYPYGAEDGYCRMVENAYAAWERLWIDLGERLYTETGTLVLSRGGDDWGERSLASLRRCAIAHETLAPAALAKRFPAINADGLSFGCFLPSGGMLLAARIVASLAALLVQKGVRLCPEAAVAAIDVESGRVRLADGSSAHADVVLVAAGAWSDRLLALYRQRVRPSRQVVVYLDTPPDLTLVWRSMPMLLEIGADSGFYVVPPRLGVGLKVGDHRFSLRGDPDGDRTAADSETSAVLAQCGGRLRDFPAYRAVEAKVCFYDMAPDERFVVERLSRRTWAMAGFSGHGFKFAPLLAERLTTAIEGRLDAGELSRWAMGRLA